MRMANRLPLHRDEPCALLPAAACARQAAGHRGRYRSAVRAGGRADRDARREREQRRLPAVCQRREQPRRRADRREHHRRRGAARPAAAARRPARGRGRVRARRGDPQADARAAVPGRGLPRSGHTAGGRAAGAAEQGGVHCAVRPDDGRPRAPRGYQPLDRGRGGQDELRRRVQVRRR